MTEAYDKAQRWLESWDPKATLSDSEVDAVRSLIGHSGFGSLLSLLGAERQGCYVALANVNLEDVGGRRQGSVLQGRIMGIERVREAVLELYEQTPQVPAEERKQ
jgi:hypothetical protein